MNRSNGIFILITLVVIGVIGYLHQSGLLSLFDGEQLKSTILSFGVWAPVLYVGLYVIASLLFIPASPLTLAGGALFGPWYGTVYTVVGATLGAVSAFLLARAVGYRFITPGTGKVSQKLHVYNEKIASHGFLTVLFLRLVPLFPFNGLNVALGLTKVSLRDYFFGTLFGIIPGTFAYVYFGDSLATLNPVNIGIGLGLIVVLSLFGKWAVKKFDVTR